MAGLSGRQPIQFIDWNKANFADNAAPPMIDFVWTASFLVSKKRTEEFVTKRLIFIPLLILWAQAAVAASPTIVDGDYVAAPIARNAVLWDVRPTAAYARGHIAAAISIGHAAKVLRDETTDDFI